jgi:ATP-dependent Lhr-like helicase
MTAFDSFHPAVRAWFQQRFDAPTDAQLAGWDAIAAGRDALIAAPTGSGKTLAAFLSSIDSLMKRGLDDGLPAGIDVVYVSPLKALSSDIQRNLDAPLEGIRDVARAMGIAPPEICTALRTGDTTQAARAAILRHAPHILITTPESLYLMLTSERSRALLRNVRTVIVDELHALMRDKRGSHLMLTLARLDALCEQRPLRIGLSATVHPIEDAAAYLVGTEAAGLKISTSIPSSPSPPGKGPGVRCTIVNVGHQRDLDLAIEVPPADLQAVAANEQWGDIYDRIAELTNQHRTTLVFVNTRRMAERIAHNLGQRLGEEHVAAHHGSLSKDRRLRLEQRLKNGEMRAIVATASLELGIDVGTVDLVCQIGSPRAITTFLQRIGRSGHALGLTSRGRLFATTRDELLECAALIRAVRGGRLDRVEPPVAPLDILAQQIVAECACREWDEDALYDLVRTTTPFAALTREDYDDVIEMLSEGAAPRVGRGRALLHRDRINRTLRGRRAARITAITCGGAIPEVADYRVILDPDETFIGTVNEDWAIESMAGDVFVLGSHSWKIRRVESARGVLRVEDAQGRPPSIPFWLGEAPGRTWELSEEVSSLRRDIAERLDDGEAVSWLRDECALDELGAQQIVDYVGAERAALGIVPSDIDIVFERFFDDAGGMQLVVHAPFGGRVNRGFGLALRKRFCVNFDFELQAAATDDAVVLSMGPQHSFPLEDAFSFVRVNNVRTSLEQAILYAPMWGARWRWNATRSLQVLRSNAGKQVPPPIQRMRSDDLLAAVFPEQVGCQENLTGPLQIPDHPLTRQTVRDCLHEAMDVDRLEAVFERIERGEIRLHARDTTEPSPFAHEILNAKPYAFLDNAPLEERRTRAVTLRRTLPESQRDLGELDAAAIERVRDEARPDPRDADELDDLLLSVVVWPGPNSGGEASAAFDPANPRPLWERVAPEAPGEGPSWLQTLIAAHRASVVRTPAGDCWFAAEHLRAIEQLYPGAQTDPPVRLPDHIDAASTSRDDAVLAAVRGHMEYLGPATADGIAVMLGLTAGEVTSALARLEGEGIVLRGSFTPNTKMEEWCDRRLLARIHRLTLDRLRSEIEPVTAQDFMRYLFTRQHVAGPRRLEGKRGVLEAIAQLQGFEVAAVAWERDVLPMRVVNYNPQWLDELCLAGDAAWARLSLKKTNATGGRGASPQRATPITLALRRDLGRLLETVRGAQQPEDPAAGGAAATLDALRQHGALFFEDLAAASRQLPAQLEEALWDLVARGLVAGDGFQSLRQIMTLAGSARARSARRHSRQAGSRLPRSTSPQGRWSIVHRFQPEPTPAEELAESVADQLLARYGVVFRDLVVRENFAVPWRDVVRALRRMEARGTARGGRFVAGFIGEQYALPEAVQGLRRVRREERSGDIVRINAADPLNLAGIITPGARVPAVHTNAVIFRDGLPIAVEEGRNIVVRPEAGDIDLRDVLGSSRPTQSASLAPASL